MYNVRRAAHNTYKFAIALSLSTISRESSSDITNSSIFMSDVLGRVMMSFLSRMQKLYLWIMSGAALASTTPALSEMGQKLKESRTQF